MSSSPSNKSLSLDEFKKETTVTTTVNTKGTSSSVEKGSVVERPAAASPYAEPKKKAFDRFLDTFRRQLPGEDLEADGSSKTKGLTTYHVALITIASGLGTGLLVGSGQALNNGGPGALLVSYTVVGIMLFFTMSAAGELAVAYPTVQGGFNAYAAKLVDPSLSFAVAWSYCINWMTVLPLEMVTATMTIKYWNEDINPDLWVIGLLAVVYGTNFFGAKGYAWVEFFFNILKVAMILTFMICGIIRTTGNLGRDDYIGFKYYSIPGAFSHGFKGVCAVFVTSAFSLGGTEFMALTAADQAEPRKAIPKAMKQVFYRLVVFYFGSILVMSLCVPFNSPQLMGSGEGHGAPASPYVIGIVQVSQYLGHFVNAVILCALISVANSALYSSSRTLLSLSQQGFAPQWFNYIDRSGRPMRAMLVSAVFSLLSFIAACDAQEQVFTWLLSLSGLAALFTWATICLSHIRFRAAFKAQGRSLQELGFKMSGLGTWSSWIGLIINIFILGVQFWVSLFPISKNGSADAENFFQNYLGMVTFLIFYIGHRIYARGWKQSLQFWKFWIPADSIDLNTDLNVVDLETKRQEKIADDEQWKNRSFVSKVFNIFC